MTQCTRTSRFNPAANSRLPLLQTYGRFIIQSRNLDATSSTTRPIQIPLQRRTQQKYSFLFRKPAHPIKTRRPIPHYGRTPGHTSPPDTVSHTCIWLTTTKMRAEIHLRDHDTLISRTPRIPIFCTYIHSHFPATLTITEEFFPIRFLSVSWRVTPRVAFRRIYNI